MDAFVTLEPVQCDLCARWRESLNDVFVYVFDEDCRCCGECYDARQRGGPPVEVDLTAEEDGELEDMIDDYSDLPMFAHADAPTRAQEGD